MNSKGTTILETKTTTRIPAKTQETEPVTQIQAETQEHKP